MGLPDNENVNINLNDEEISEQIAFLPNGRRTFNRSYKLIDSTAFHLERTPKENLKDVAFLTNSPFIFYLDGTVSTNGDREFAATNSFLAELEAEHGIRDIEQCNEGEVQTPGSQDYVAYTNDGYAYAFAYDVTFKDRETKVYECDKIRVFNNEIVMLNSDGTIDCNTFPEVSEWTDIVDFEGCDDYIVGLKSNGELVSVGIDFTAKNIVAIGNMFVQEFKSYWPVALTADGTLIFPEGYGTEFESVICQARNFTDVVDFICIKLTDSSLAILALRTDGSLIATKKLQNYNSEYINQLE